MWRQMPKPRVCRIKFNGRKCWMCFLHKSSSSSMDLTNVLFQWRNTLCAMGSMSPVSQLLPFATVALVSDHPHNPCCQISHECHTCGSILPVIHRPNTAMGGDTIGRGDTFLAIITTIQSSQVLKHDSWSHVNGWSTYTLSAETWAVTSHTKYYQLDCLHSSGK
jgi:hypothetical protein